MTNAIAEYTAFDLAAQGQLHPQDAFERLLMMCQDDAGNITDFDAYQYLMVVYEATNAVFAQATEAQARVSGLEIALQSVIDDRNTLAMDIQRRVESARERGEKSEHRRIVRAFAQERGLSDEAADYLLQFIIGEGTHAITPYVQRIVSQALDGVIDDLETEVDDEYNRESEEMEYHDDED